MSTTPSEVHRESTLIVHQDWSKTKEKRRAIVGDGVESLHVVLDFDHTITAYLSPTTGEKCLECHDVVQHGTYDPSERQASFRADIEGVWSDQRNGRLRCLSEWWSRFHDAIASHELTETEVRQATASSQVALRPGAAELFAWLREHAVRTTILSAGISTVIEEVLRRHDIEVHEQARIIANVPVLDGSERIVSFREPLVYSRNKAQVLKTLEFGNTGENARSPDNIVLAGNAIGDVQCLSGMPHGRSLSLGFLHEELSGVPTARPEICASGISSHRESTVPLADREHSNLDNFLEHYDVVMCGHQSNFQYLLDLLGEIKKGS